MLKTRVYNNFWLVQQHHHAQVSGYLAAQWGNDRFARPGGYPGATDPDLWREAVVLGIAEHDNGWWETEAIPKINGPDGLPVGLGRKGQAGGGQRAGPVADRRVRPLACGHRKAGRAIPLRGLYWSACTRTGFTRSVTTT
ncbi:MAG: DUF3891 family protein [Phycisphaerales bacterium]